MKSSWEQEWCWGEDTEALFILSLSQAAAAVCVNLFVKFWNKRKTNKILTLALASKFWLSKSQSHFLWLKPDENSYYHPTLPHRLTLLKSEKQSKLWKVKMYRESQPWGGHERVPQWRESGGVAESSKGCGGVKEELCTSQVQGHGNQSPRKWFLLQRRSWNSIK